VLALRLNVSRWAYRSMTRFRRHRTSPGGKPATLSGASIVDGYILRRLFQRERLRQLATDRLTEPLHLNMVAAAVALFGSFRAKVAFDLIGRRQYAYPMLHAADKAREQGLRRLSAIEFGVAKGAGLINMCKIAISVEKATGVAFDVYGFDSGAGMPAPIDYRDHPEEFQEGDFPMDHARLAAALPSFAHLVLGDVAETVPVFLDGLSPAAPLCFVALDMDYYSSARRALEVFKSAPEKYLPGVTLYLDDIEFETANPWCGELLALDEFNRENASRKIAPCVMLRARRLLKNARWIDHMFTVHILDHPARRPERTRRPAMYIENEYL
jgi:hypothetical protein